MKSYNCALLIPLLGSFLLIGDVLAEHHEDGTDSIDAEKETLYIEYRDNKDAFHMPRYNSINNELDRFYYLKQNFERAFEKEDWGVKFDFQRFPIKAPEGAKVLEITFLNLDAPNRIELELRIWAKLEEGDKEEDFGVHRVRLVPSAFPTSNSIDRDLDKIYTKAAQKVVSDLNNSLFDEE